MIKKLKTVRASARKILLVDDNPKERHIRAIMLNTHGYDVDSVSNIDDAYRFSQTKHPDLVLLALSRDSDGRINSLGAHKPRQSWTAGRFFGQQFTVFEPNF